MAVEPNQEANPAMASTHSAERLPRLIGVDQNGKPTVEIKRNPRDSMKSTWRTADRSNWNIHHWILEILRINPTDIGRDIPVHDKSEKIPFLPNWTQNRWVLVHAAIPLLLQQIYYSATGTNFSPGFAFFWYTFWLHAIAIKELINLRHLSHKYGFLDGEKERDQIPDHSVFKVLASLASTATLRPAMSVILAYRTSLAPSTMNFLILPLEIGCYTVVLDFWFYWYHRLMHGTETLWRFHRTHHLTKHPNPLLTLYADTEQEFFDMVGIPILTYCTMKFVFGFPMGFYEWWVCQQYIVYTELLGHSGLRIFLTPPNPLNWLLFWLKAELVTEDHDLHHRKGWKKSHNYGKQTRVWDRLFGTCADRIESEASNIDYNQRVDIPLLWTADY